MRNARPRFITATSSHTLGRLVAPALVACGALVGCADDAGPRPTPPVEGQPVVLSLTSDNNYNSTSKLTIPSIPTVEEDDVTIDWNAITKDLQCHPVNAKEDIDDVSLVRVASSSQMEVSGWIDRGELGIEKTKEYFEFKPDGNTTNANLSLFQDAGKKLIDLGEQYKEQTGITYLLVFASGTKLGFGTRTMYFLEPGGSNDSEVFAKADSCDDPKYLAFDAHLDMANLPVPAEGPWEVEWSSLKIDSQGNAIQAGGIDSMLIGFYKGKEVVDLEDDFLFLQDATPATGGPDRSWKVSIPATAKKAAISGAQGRTVEADFVDFNTDGETGTWLLGLFCGSCQNPAPIYVTILDPQ